MIGSLLPPYGSFNERGVEKGRGVRSSHVPRVTARAPAGRTAYGMLTRIRVDCPRLQPRRRASFGSLRLRNAYRRRRDAPIPGASQENGVASKISMTRIEDGPARILRKAPTVAVAGALAAPMAAQAVDFTISGHVNRALVVVNTDGKGGMPDRSKAEVKNNGSSSTRIRRTGSSEMMDGNSVGIQVEYQETGDGSLGLRHANVNYAGEFGKLTIGQGSEAGDGSAYKGGVATFGVGHGQEMGSATLGPYFGSLDAGTRTNMIRYDTPAIGPVGAAVSIRNPRQVLVGLGTFNLSQALPLPGGGPFCLGCR